MYHGIILDKTYFGVFIDIGYAFNWKSGSLVGLLHKSHFETTEHFENIEIGTVIKILFWGYNEKEQLIYGLKAELKEWFTNEIEQLIGKILPVRVLKASDNNVTYIVQDRFSATLLINNLIYPENKLKIKKAIRNLEDGEIINCEILSVNKPKRTFQLKWDTPSEIEKIFSRNIIKGNLRPQKTYINATTRNTIENIINNETAERLNLIGKTVEVKVVKENKSFGSSRIKVKYLVEDKYIGILKIYDEFFTFGVSEIKHIEKNLENGEIINCKVLSVRNNIVNIQWSFSNKDRFRFFR